MFCRKFNKQSVKRDDEASLISDSRKRCNPLIVAVDPIVAESVWVLISECERQQLRQLRPPRVLRECHFRTVVGRTRAGAARRILSSP